MSNADATGASTRDVEAQVPYGLTRDSYHALHTTFRGGLFGSMLFGLIAGLGCAGFGSWRTGLTMLSIGIFVSGILFAKKRYFFSFSGYHFALQTLGMAYFQLCFVVPAAVVSFQVASSSALALLLVAMVAAVFFYARYYYRAYWRAWESKKQHNEKSALNLEDGFYFPAERFKTAEVQSLGWDEKIGKALCVIGPMGGAALGVVSGRGDGVGVLMIFCAALCFFIGTAWSQMTVQGIVNWQKIRHYERQVGQEIRNR